MPRHVLATRTVEMNNPGTIQRSNVHGRTQPWARWLIVCTLRDNCSRMSRPWERAGHHFRTTRPGFTALVIGSHISWVQGTNILVIVNASHVHTVFHKPLVWYSPIEAGGTKRTVFLCRLVWFIDQIVKGVVVVVVLLHCSAWNF